MMLTILPVSDTMPVSLKRSGEGRAVVSGGGGEGGCLRHVQPRAGLPGRLRRREVSPQIPRQNVAFNIRCLHNSSAFWCSM
jgi:hypothetical protein